MGTQRSMLVLVVSASLRAGRLKAGPLSDSVDYMARCAGSSSAPTVSIRTSTIATTNTTANRRIVCSPKDVSWAYLPGRGRTPVGDFTLESVLFTMPRAVQAAIDSRLGG